MNNRLTRRQTLQLMGAAMAVASVPSGRLLADSGPGSMLKKPIPATEQKLPVIGMGTWQTFNVGSDPQLLDARTEVVREFFRLGGGLVDSSPMYGSAPDVMGHALKKLGTPESLFAAEKVWSPAGGSASEQVADLAGRWGIGSFDLVQVHNLTNWRDYLASLQKMKADGKLGYVGITTSHGRRHRDFEQIMGSEDIDFIQLTYNITHREVENWLLPLAQEKGIAVIANRPYDGGGLIKGLKRRGEKLPQWAVEECGCRTWADFLLKFIVSHPAVTCAIPATSEVEHMRENMLAGRAPMPSPSARRKMAAYIESL